MPHMTNKNKHHGMKNIFSLLIIIGFSLNTIAQTKVVERSGKEPNWINNIAKNYIITSGSGKTVELAKEDAISMVKEQIVKSVADRVIAKSELVKSETSINNNQSNIIENFKSNISSESGKIDFLNGININKVVDFYWEKVKNKKSKTYNYNYYIKYPFNNGKLNELIATYKKKDTELTQELEKCLKELDNINSTEQIASTINELKQLRERFIDRRQDKADLAIEKLYNLYKSADFKILSNKSGNISFYLSINNKDISTTVKPTIKSNCAKIIGLKKEGESWVLNYNSEDCYENEENYVMLYLKLPNRRIKKKIYIDITQDMAKISLIGDITLKRDTITKNNTCSLSIKSEYTSPLTIESIKLEFTANKTISFDKLDKTFEGGGIYNLNLALPENTTIDNSTGFISGYITYKSVNSDKKHTYRIYKHRYNLCL